MDKNAVKKFAVNARRKLIDSVSQKAYGLGISKDEIKEVVHEMALKKYKVLSKRESDEYKLSQKLYRFLMGKGYDYDLIKDVVKSVVKSEDLE